MKTAYKICTNCIMDTTDPEIVFDQQGVCNHCHRYERINKTRIIPFNERPLELKKLVDKIKISGIGQKYDCIIGVSGGVDSTYVAHLVKEHGLKPLAVHFDNGWNSELAVSNIEKTLKTLGIDLFTYVVDWDEFKDLQLSFLSASTPDAEIPTDHGILAVLHKVASKNNVKHILLGHNYSTEAILPNAWGYGYFDARYIQDVHSKFGKVKLKTYPLMSLAKFIFYTQVKKIKINPILNYIDYNKSEAMDLIENKLGWVNYGGKHYESIYTRFFQAYILPRKFNIDKRRAHLSTLINSNQMTRDQALEELKQPIFDPTGLKNDKEYVIKKLGLTSDEFESIMEKPVKSFHDYKNIYKLFERLKKYRNRVYSN
jgi:N-acetyl sugar amidotransferase